MNNLETLRHKIDSIDTQIISLLEERVRIAEGVAVIKNQLNMPLTDSQREQEMLHELENKTQNSLLKQNIHKIYQIIFAMSKALRGATPTLA